MACLPDFEWKTYYSPGHGHLVRDFYLPALSCAVRYDRSTGYFNAPALALAMRGLEGLIANSGHMRLLVGCTLNESEVEAIERGHTLRDTVEALLLTYFDLGGTLVNINVMDAETVREAYEDPSRHPDLIVRVTGFSAYFASLSDELRRYVVDRIV